MEVNIEKNAEQSETRTFQKVSEGIYGGEGKLGL